MAQDFCSRPAYCETHRGPTEQLWAPKPSAGLAKLIPPSHPRPRMGNACTTTCFSLTSGFGVAKKKGRKPASPCQGSPTNVHGIIVCGMKPVNHEQDHHKHHLSLTQKGTKSSLEWLDVKWWDMTLWVPQQSSPAARHRWPAPRWAPQWR